MLAAAGRWAEVLGQGPREGRKRGAGAGRGGLIWSWATVLGSLERVADADCGRWLAGVAEAKLRQAVGDQGWTGPVGG